MELIPREVLDAGEQALHRALGDLVGQDKTAVLVAVLHVRDPIFQATGTVPCDG